MILDIRMMMGELPSQRPDRAENAGDCGFNDLVAAEPDDADTAVDAIVLPDAVLVAMAPFPVPIAPAVPDGLIASATAETLPEVAAKDLMIALPEGVEGEVPRAELPNQPPKLSPPDPEAAPDLQDKPAAPKIQAEPAAIAFDQPPQDSADPAASETALRLPGPSGLSIVLRALAYPADESPRIEETSAATDDLPALAAPAQSTEAGVPDDPETSHPEKEKTGAAPAVQLNTLSDPAPDAADWTAAVPGRDNAAAPAIPQAARAEPPVATAPVPTPAPVQHASTEATDVTPSDTGGIALDLSSDDLGTLRMEITRSGEKLNIAVTADRTDTIDLARRHAAEFVADLRQSGYGQTDMSFGQWAGQRPHPRADNGAAPSAPGADDPLPVAPRADRGQPDGAQLDIRI